MQSDFNWSQSYRFSSGDTAKSICVCRDSMAFSVRDALDSLKVLSNFFHVIAIRRRLQNRESARGAHTLLIALPFSIANRLIGHFQFFFNYNPIVLFSKILSQQRTDIDRHLAATSGDVCLCFSINFRWFSTLMGTFWQRSISLSFRFISALLSQFACINRNIATPVRIRWMHNCCNWYGKCKRSLSTELNAISLEGKAVQNASFIFADFISVSWQLHALVRL